VRGTTTTTPQPEPYKGGRCASVFPKLLHDRTARRRTVGSLRLERDQPFLNHETPDHVSAIAGQPSDAGSYKAALHSRPGRFDLAPPALSIEVASDRDVCPSSRGDIEKRSTVPRAGERTLKEKSAFADGRGKPLRDAETTKTPIPCVMKNAIRLVLADRPRDIFTGEFFGAGARGDLTGAGRHRAKGHGNHPVRAAWLPRSCDVGGHSGMSQGAGGRLRLRVRGRSLKNEGKGPGGMVGPEGRCQKADW